MARPGTAGEGGRVCELPQDATHFLTLTFWTSEEAIRGFAGDDLLQAKYYPEDAAFLLEFEPRVRHYRIVASG